VEFSDTARLSVGLTARTEEIQTALKNAKPGGLTAMFDCGRLPALRRSRAMIGRMTIQSRSREQ